MGVAVVKDGETIFAGGFGLRDREQGLPVSADTIFAIGSASKAFTAASVALMVDDGKLEVIFAHPLKFWNRIRYLPVIEKGRHLHLPVVDYFQATAITVIAGEVVPAHLDGEYFAAERFEISLLPGKLSVRC